MMTREDGVINWSTSHNSPLEYSKLALIDFAHQNSTKPRPQLQLPNRTINPVTSTKYLGVIFDQNLKWSTQLANITEKGTKWAAQIKRATRTTWGITPKYARRLYIGVALPKVLYAIDIWCTPLHGAAVGPRRKGSVAAVKRLTTTQRAGTIAITGGLRTSPTDTLDACAFTIPAAHLVEKWCYKAAVRLSTLPPEHPLYRPVKASANRYTRKHKAPLHNLMQLFALKPDSTAKISVTVRNPLDANLTPLHFSIANSKEASKAEANNAPEIVKVYTDGAILGGQAGVAAILQRHGKPTRKLHYHLGNETEHTIHEAELTGILLGLQLIKTEKKGSTTFALGTDSQKALKTLTSDLILPEQQIALNILKLIKQVRNNRSPTRYSLTMRWTAGHMGIRGNVIADKEAKAAAGGTTTDKKSLPKLLRRKLTINPTALKHTHNEAIKTKWKSEWANTPRGGKLTTLDDKTPSTKLLNIISSSRLTRKASSLIAQFCIGHVPLNSYLYKFKLTDSPRCPACGAVQETINHFIITCPTYAHMRWPLKRKCKGTLTLAKILNNPELIKNLITYIEETKRFKQQGEYLRLEQ